MDIEHINAGTPRDSCNCPIALAIKDYGGVNPHVGGYILFTKGNIRYTYNAPRPACDFMGNFDRNTLVPEPFTLILDEDNLMTELTIEVTQKHINEGLTGSCKLCPVSLAINDHFVKEKVDIDNIYVTDHYMEFHLGEKIKRISNPMSVKVFIFVFDDLATWPLAKPFKFSIKVPNYLWIKNKETLDVN